MKVKALGKKPELCNGCRDCETVCAKTFFKVEDRERASLRIVDLKGEPKHKIITCTHCGDCIAVCPTQAIRRMKTGLVMIDKNKCIGCLSCVGFCPETAMFQYREVTLPFKCSSCGKCVKECKTGAIFMGELEATKFVS